MLKPAHGFLAAIAGFLALVPSTIVAGTFAGPARAAHRFLTELCDDFGGRLTGSGQNRAALERLASELRSMGLRPEFEEFEMPGWQRGNDSVEIVLPLSRRLRVAALAYTQPHEPFEAEVIDVAQGREGDYAADAAGKILLLGPSSGLSVREFTAMASGHGARGVLFIDREGGGQLLARTGSFTGEELPMPVFTLSQEEGLWIRRLLGRGEHVRVRMETRSRCVPVKTANLHVVLAGRSSERIVVGAHFDSWDLGQGAMDNGLGVAQLVAIAGALHGKELERTVELVWFNGEEQGLWGSRRAASRIGDEPIVAMINLDMVGVPRAVNALGDDSLVDSLTRWNEGRGKARLEGGVENINWFGSDHTPYQLAGVRSITFNAPIPRESVRFYHDFGDTIDKLPEQIVVDSSGIIGDLVLALARDSSLGAARRSRDETVAMFTRFNLVKKLEAVGFWDEDANAPRFGARE